MIFTVLMDPDVVNTLNYICFYALLMDNGEIVMALYWSERERRIAKGKDRRGKEMRERET